MAGAAISQLCMICRMCAELTTCTKHEPVVHHCATAPVHTYDDYVACAVSAELEPCRSELAVRINAVDSGLASHDLQAVLAAKRLPDAIVVPKVGYTTYPPSIAFASPLIQDCSCACQHAPPCRLPLSILNVAHSG